MGAAFALLRIQLEIAHQDYNVKRIQEFQMLRENVCDQVRLQIKPFKIQGFTTINILFEHVLMILFHFEGNGYNPNIRPIHPGQTSNEQGVKYYLRSKGCKCHDTPYLNITSSDSR